MYILPLFWTMLHILNQTRCLSVFPHDSYVYQLKRVGRGFVLMYTNAISWNKFLSVYCQLQGRCIIIMSLEFFLIK
jgi:hypothetical protein